MATSECFKDFVLECLNEAECGGEFSFLARKMFGEYCIYVIDKGIKKVLFLVCDDSVFVRKFDEISSFALQNSAYFSVGYPYDGAKEHYIIDIENIEFLGELLRILIPLCRTSK